MNHTIFFIIIAYFFALFIFAIDIIVPVNYAVWLLYAVGALPFCLYARIGAMFAYKILCSILILAGWFLSARTQIIPDVFLFNRILGIIVLWVAAYLIWVYRKARVHLSELEEKNRELDAFTYSISHELRNPLQSIVACTSTLMADSALTANNDRRRALDYIQDATGQMTGIITALLALSRASRHEMHRGKVDLSEIASSYFDEFKNAHPERKVTIDIKPDLIADADPILARILLGNLVRNAWKFTAGKQEAHIAFFAVQEHDTQYFCIRDNGAGFEMRNANHLFKPFSRLHRNDDFPGSGIGLTVVKRILEKHGGSIRVEAAPDQGASFFFTFGKP